MVVRLHSTFLVAKKAWKALPEGTHEDFEGHRVVKREYIVLVMPRLSGWPSNREEDGSWKADEPHIVAYPATNLRDFSRSQRSLEEMGPSERYPASIGVLRTTPIIARGFALGVKYVQANYSTSSSAPLLGTIANRYAVWRAFAIRELLEITRMRNLEVHVNPRELGNKNPRSLLDKFLREARKKKLPIKEEEDGKIIINARS